MPITVECDDCGFSFDASRKFAGKRVRCPECSQPVRVDASGDATSGSDANVEEPDGNIARPARPDRPARPARPSSSSRPARPDGKKQSAGGGNKTIMIAGGALIVVLLGVIAFMATRGDGQPGTDQPEQDAVAIGPPDVSKDLKQAAREAEARALEREERIAAAEAEAAARVATSTGKFPAPAKGGGLPDPPPGVSAIALPPITGDRVAWLSPSGHGFAKKEDMWVFNGQPSLLGIPVPSQSVRLSFNETQRTDSLVELFNTEHMLRVRLKTFGQSIAYYLPGKTQKPLQNGVLLDTTADASSWLATASLPANRLQETPTEFSDVPSLIESVRKHVARIDVGTIDGTMRGTGFLADASGRIVTSYQAVEGCLQAKAVFNDAGPNGNTIEAPILGVLHADPSRNIAILQAALPGDFLIRGLPLASETKQDERVIAFGAPLSLGSSTANGTISGHRTSDELEESLGVGGFKGNWVQTTTPISPGNSGGPLVNRAGEVVAINTRNPTSDQQLNFAISADDIRAAIDTSSPTPTPFTPKSLPVAVHQSTAGTLGPDGQPWRSGRRITITYGLSYIDLWTIEGSAHAIRYLAELDELVMDVSITKPVVKSGVENAATNAVRNAGIKLATEEGPTLLIVPELERRSETAFQLQLFAHLYVVRNGEALRIWRGSENFGHISTALLEKGSVGSSLETRLATFFGDLTTQVSNARNGIISTPPRATTKGEPFSGQ